MSNTAIIRKEFRQSITFTNTPEASTCKALRAAGFDFDRRTSQWFRHDITGESHDEKVVAADLAA